MSVCWQERHYITAAVQAGPAVLMCRDVGVGGREQNTTEASENLVAWSAFCVAPSKRETSKYYNTSDGEVARATGSAFTAKLTLLCHFKNIKGIPTNHS